MQGYQPQKNKYMWTGTENDPIPSPPPPTSGSNAVPNLNNKRLSLQLEQIAEDFCNNYCKYPEIWDEEKEGCELSESDICANCPISRI